MKVGVLGGGQLGLMLAEAGEPLGLSFRFLDTSPHACAGRAGELFVDRPEDLATLAQFVSGLSHVTYESENVPLETARWLSMRIPFAPPPGALRVSQDRLREKEFLESLGIRVAPFRAVDERDHLVAATEALGFPCILKTRRFGYDGRGQAFLRSGDDVETAWSRLGGVPLILEGFVPFVREVSQVAVRDGGGRVVCYPLSENTHRDGILRESIAPAPDSDAIAAAAGEAARLVAAELGYVGALAIEFFDTGGQLVANEIAPRVHNSGHWTIEGTDASQFENHLRALTGMPLVEPRMRGESAWMLNLIGDVPEWVWGLAGAHAHEYGKEARPGRKVGHLTVVGSRAEVDAARAEARRLGDA